MKRRIAIVLALWVPLAGAQPAVPQEPFPSRPLKLVIPWPPGGDTDVIGRLIAQKLSEALDKPVVVENRQGGSGAIGAQAVVRAPADGYTLLVSSMSTHAMNQHLSKLDFDPVEDVTPISMLVRIPAALVAHPSVPFDDVKGLVAAAKANPGKLNVGSGSNAYQLFLEQFKTAADVKIEHVRYRGAGPAVNDLLGGQVEMLITGLPVITQHVKAGKLKVIGLTGAKRARAMPDVATFNETIDGLQFDNWTGMFVRAGTPRPIVDRLNAEVARILAQPDVRERLTAMGAEPASNSSDQMAAILRSDADRMGKIIKASGIKSD